MSDFVVEHKDQVADADHVIALQPTRLFDPLFIDKGTIAAVQILDVQTVTMCCNLRVAPAHSAGWANPSMRLTLILTVGWTRWPSSTAL